MPLLSLLALAAAGGWRVGHVARLFSDELAGLVKILGADLTSRSATRFAQTVR